MSNQKMIIALLGVVAVLLAGIVGVLLLKPANADVATVDPAAVAADPNAAAQPPAGMGGAPSEPFDPKTATPADGDPKAHVEKYFNAIVKKDFATAFKLLPKDKQAQGQEAFAAQIQGYGMNKFTMGKADIKDDTAVVEATAETSGGPFTYIWSFKKVDGKWLVESRKIGGMGQ